MDQLSYSVKVQREFGDHQVQHPHFTGRKTEARGWARTRPQPPSPGLFLPGQIAIRRPAPSRWVSRSMGGREKILPVNQKQDPCSGRVIDVHCHQQGEVL